jgi:hypothetical protein
VAETTNTHRVSDWNASIEKLNELNLKLDECQPQDRDTLERAIADQQDDVLNTPAPTWTALLAKMELLFEGQLEGLDAEAEYRRLLLEDVSDLIAETRELVGNLPETNHQR